MSLYLLIHIPIIISMMFYRQFCSLQLNNSISNLQRLLTLVWIFFFERGSGRDEMSFTMAFSY